MAIQFSRQYSKKVSGEVKRQLLIENLFWFSLLV
jgi:hypothetical protein